MPAASPTTIPKLSVEAECVAPDGRYYGSAAATVTVGPPAPVDDRDHRADDDRAAPAEPPEAVPGEATLTG